MKVKNHMRFNIITVSKDMKVIDLMKIYRTVSIKSRLSYVIGNGYKLYGIISMYDIVKVLSSDQKQIQWLEEADTKYKYEIFESLYRERLDLDLSSIMKESYYSVRPEDDLMCACRVIQDNKVTAVPVIDECGCLVGEISRRTMLEYLTDLVLDPQDNIVKHFFPCI